MHTDQSAVLVAFWILERCFVRPKAPTAMRKNTNGAIKTCTYSVPKTDYRTSPKPPTLLALRSPELRNSCTRSRGLRALLCKRHSYLLNSCWPRLPPLPIPRHPLPPRNSCILAQLSCTAKGSEEITAYSLLPSRPL